MDSERPSLDQELQDLGTRWEIVDTGITVKLYPSCAATHPTLDAVLDLRRRHAVTTADVDRIDVAVDSITPTVLIHSRPATGLEAKFSMEYCVAAAIVRGVVGIDTFDAASLGDPEVQALLPRVTMRVDPGLDGVAPPLTQSRVAIVLRDGRTISQEANGARGYPDRPASADELGAKFLGCAKRTIAEDAAHQALERLRGIDGESDIRTVASILRV
jgi:2-methylcitrate dehydratase PrpD